MLAGVLQNVEYHFSLLWHWIAVLLAQHPAFKCCRCSAVCVYIEYVVCVCGVFVCHFNCILSYSKIVADAVQRTEVSVVVAVKLCVVALVPYNCKPTNQTLLTENSLY